MKLGRSLYRAITWRFTATAATMLVAWIVTGQVETTITIGVAEFLLKIFLYMMHDYLWGYTTMPKYIGLEEGDYCPIYKECVGVKCKVNRYKNGRCITYNKVEGS